MSDTFDPPQKKKKNPWSIQGFELNELYAPTSNILRWHLMHIDLVNFPVFLKASTYVFLKNFLELENMLKGLWYELLFSGIMPEIHVYML